MKPSPPGHRSGAGSWPSSITVWLPADSGCEWVPAGSIPVVADKPSLHFCSAAPAPGQYTEPRRMPFFPSLAWQSRGWKCYSASWVQRDSAVRNIVKIFGVEYHSLLFWKVQNDLVITPKCGDLLPRLTWMPCQLSPVRLLLVWGGCSFPRPLPSVSSALCGPPLQPLPLPTWNLEWVLRRLINDLDFLWLILSLFVGFQAFS